MTASVVLSCGSLTNGSTNSTGDFDISVEGNFVDFSASEGNPVYKAIPIKNSLTGPITIVNLIIGNNLCGDFSLYQVLDESGQIVLFPGDPISINVPGGSKVKIVIRFGPTPCPYTDYESILYVYYNDGIRLNRLAITLKPTVTGPRSAGGGEEVECEVTPVDPQFSYTDVPITGQLPASVDENEFFLKVDLMRGYIHNTQIPATTGTDVDATHFPDPYEATFLKITGNTDGAFTLAQIDDCTRFVIPSSTNDTNFAGANITLTTYVEAVGGSDASGLVQLNDLEVHLSTSGIPLGSDSLIHVGGRFGITLIADLTTGTTPPDPYIFTMLDEIDEDVPSPFIETVNTGTTDGIGNPIYALKGSPLANGKMILVGIGFFNNRDFIGEEIAENVLFDEVARIFIRLDVSVTRRVVEETEEE